MNNKKHTFVICAYEESKYLESCILSLKNQKIESTILMVTATPNAHIEGLAEKFEIPLFINRGEKGMVQDWNFALDQCSTPYVTIAHQDDIYFENYAKIALKELEECEKPLIFFSDYVEIRENIFVAQNGLLRVKRLMLLPLKYRTLQKSRFVRRRILSLGNPICCPTVTYAMNHLPRPIFTKGFNSNQDWESWERISKLRGSFIYGYKKKAMAHRIHENSETSRMIMGQMRKEEDYKMFCKFWPKCFAELLVKLYSRSEKYNQLER